MRDRIANRRKYMSTEQFKAGMDRENTERRRTLVEAAKGTADARV